MNQDMKTGLFLWLFFAFGLAVGSYEQYAHVGSTFAVTAGLVAAFLQYIAAKWLHRSRA